MTTTREHGLAPTTPTTTTIAFLGGNGHGAVRLERARALLPDGVALASIAYPGFADGPPRAPDFATFLDTTAAGLARVAPDLVYATGIGGLVALALRADGRLAAPLLMQAPVLWGLETRLMPRVMRAVPLVRDALHGLFRTAPFRRWFVRRYFVRPPDAAVLARFFAAYDACAALPDLFAWLSPSLLRELEAAIRRAPERFADVRLWWGDRDRVVPVSDWSVTARRAGLMWPLQSFRAWGHYPMLEHPEAWVQALVHVASAR